MAKDDQSRRLARVLGRGARDRQMAIEALKKTALPESTRLKSLLEQNSSVRNLLASFDQQEKLLRLAEGPLAELRSMGALSQLSEMNSALQQAQQAMRDFEARFQSPAFETVSRLIKEYERSFASSELKRFSDQMSEVQKATEAIRAPWLDLQDPFRSIKAVADLQGIGHTLNQLPSFDIRATESVRNSLGDWRDPITWPSAIFTDLAVRGSFYEERGFNPALTDLPADAFQETIIVTNIRQQPPPIVELYGPPIPSSDDDEEEEALSRTNSAHDWLIRLEMNIRRFIDDVMTSQFGDNWPRHRAPKDVYDSWVEKRNGARQAGVSDRALISYADFTDYQKIICRKDNWREVFKGYFLRTEYVVETFQRMYPIRLDTMHARPITQDDELMLYVETRRLIKVIGR